MKRNSIILLLLFYGFSVSVAAETINIGSDKKVEVIDGTIRETTAVDALKYLTNVYQRHESVTTRVGKIRKHYRGPLEADFTFLNGKSWFLDAIQASQRRNPSELEVSYVNFIQLFDGHRNHRIVKSGELLKTIDKAIHLLLTEPKFGFSDRMSYAHLNDLLRFGALRQYVAGKPSAELEQYIRAAYSKSISWDSSNLKKGTHQLDNGKVVMLASFRPDELRGCVSNSPYPSGEIVGAGLFLNVLSHALEAEAGVRGFLARYSRLPPLDDAKCNLKVLRLPGGYKDGDIFDGRASKLKINGVRVDGTNGRTFFNLAELIKGNKGPYALDIDVGDDYTSTPSFAVSGTWSGELTHSGYFNKHELWISQLNVGVISLKFPPLLDHIMATKGNIYDWVGIVRSGSAKPDDSRKAPGIL